MGERISVRHVLQRVFLCLNAGVGHELDELGLTGEGGGHHLFELVHLLLEPFDAGVGPGEGPAGVALLRLGADAAHVVVVERLVEHHLERVLDEEPDDAVDPDEGDEARVDGDHRAEGPVGGEDGGDEGGEDSAAEEERSGLALEEEALRARREDGEEVGERNLEVKDHHHLLVRDALDAERGLEEAVLVVGVEAPVEEEHRGGDGDEPEPRRDREDDGEVPALGLRRRHDVVVRDGDDGAVVEDGDDDERHDGEDEVGGVVGRRGVVGAHVVDRVREELRDEKEAEELDGARDAVDDVVLHALEDAARDGDGVDDDGEPGRGEDEVGRGARGVRRALDRDAHVCLLERRRVVHAVARHAARPAALAERLDDEELVLGEHLSEAVAVFNHLAVLVTERERNVALHVKVGQAVGAQDVVPHAERAACLLSDGAVVARDHLDGHAVLVGALDGNLGVRARRVEEGEHANHLHACALVRLGHRESANAALREFLNLGFELLLDRLAVRRVAQPEHDVRRALHHLEDAAVRALERRFRPLLDGVERRVVELRVLVERREVDGVEHERVESILRRLLPLGRERGVREDDVAVHAVAVRNRVLKHHLVEGERASLVAAQHVHRRELLDGGEARHDSLLVRELARAERHCRGAHHLHRDRDGGDEQHHGERERAEKLLTVLEEVDEADGDEEDGHHEQELGDLEENDLEVTNLVHRVDHCRRLAEEGVLAGGRHESLRLTSSDGGAHLGHVIRIKGDRERLARQRRLVHVDRVTLAQASVSRHSRARVERNAVTRHELVRRHVFPNTVALHHSLRL
mmetsp:Transcript_15235/g.50024  ORF Transcript_15235/g.50024 Transcript_15235/m.50024 type:complete len:809 (-) Transcript_15235:487-2913(-)